MFLFWWCNGPLIELIKDPVHGHRPWITGRFTFVHSGRNQMIHAKFRHGFIFDGREHPSTGAHILGILSI